MDDGYRPLSDAIESRLPFFIRGGRAVFSVMLEGYVGRPRSPGASEPDSRSDEYVDYVVRRVTELRRGLDYLETRQDIDRSRIAFMAVSAGTWTGLILTGVETRYRSVLLLGTGLRQELQAQTSLASS